MRPNANDALRIDSSLIELLLRLRLSLWKGWRDTPN
jgi:hypothetical protein